MKNQSVIIISLLSVGIGFSIGYAVASNHLSIPYQMSNDVMQKALNKDTKAQGSHMMPDGTMMGTGDSSESMGMMNGMDASMMTVTSEQDFLEKMIPHHQEAVDTAKEVIARGGSTPEIKKLAENIVVAQEKEIASMKQWYQSWYKKTYNAVPGYTPMMRDLSTLRGAELDTVFLEDMGMHHMGAIMMAKSVEKYSTHKEVTDLAHSIIESQLNEIQMMRRYLRSLVTQ